MYCQRSALGAPNGLWRIILDIRLVIRRLENSCGHTCRLRGQFSPMIEMSLASASTSNPQAKHESIANKPGEYSSKLLLESQAEHAECKQMMKKLDETMYVADFT